MRGRDRTRAGTGNGGWRVISLEMALSWTEKGQGKAYRDWDPVRRDGDERSLET